MNKPTLIPKWARKRVAQTALGPDARLADWQQVSEDARLHYVRCAYQKLMPADLGPEKPLLIVAGLKQFYSNRENQHTKLSMAFGMAFTAVAKGYPIP